MRITKVVVITLALITFLLLPVVGCVPTSTQTYSYTDFTRIEVGYGFQVELVQSNSYSISIIRMHSTPIKRDTKPDRIKFKTGFSTRPFK